MVNPNDYSGRTLFDILEELDFKLTVLGAGSY